jgi:hypothetical protein
MQSPKVGERECEDSTSRASIESPKEDKRIGKQFRYRQSIRPVCRREAKAKHCDKNESTD